MRVFGGTRAMCNACGAEGQVCRIWVPVLARISVIGKRFCSTLCFWQAFLWVGVRTQLASTL